jgi:hypothetical protein
MEEEVVERATAARAVLRRPVETKFYGDRSGAVSDPLGHVWNIATYVEKTERFLCESFCEAGLRALERRPRGSLDGYVELFK